MVVEILFFHNARRILFFTFINKGSFCICLWFRTVVPSICTGCTVKRNFLIEGSYQAMKLSIYTSMALLCESAKHLVINLCSIRFSRNPLKMKSGLAVRMAMANSKWEKDSNEIGCLEHCINLILTCMHARIHLLLGILELIQRLDHYAQLCPMVAETGYFPFTYFKLRLPWSQALHIWVSKVYTLILNVCHMIYMMY
jgi:hypothetical protein